MLWLPQVCPFATKDTVTLIQHAFNLVMLVYDTIITLDREAHVVWQSRWSGVKVLYFFNR